MYNGKCLVAGIVHMKEREGADGGDIMGGKEFFQADFGKKE